MFSSTNFRLIAAAFAAPLCVLASPALATTGPGTKPAPAQTLVAAVASPVAATTSADPAAPQLVQVRGVVLNADGRPCPGASVFPAGAPRQLVVTDAQGAFVLPVPAGTAVSLQVDYFGVGSSRVTVDKPSAEPVRVVLGR